MNRRQFLFNLGACAALTSVPSALAFSNKAARPAKVLVLGGRDFFGPTLVERLLARGHQVTLFNRGITNPHLFTDLPWVKGDREAEGGLEALKQHLKNHTYDWVVDTWQKRPIAVQQAAELLKPYVGHYQYVSSIIVYAGFRLPTLSEANDLRDVSNLDPSNDEMHYIHRKTLSEYLLEETLGDKLISFRSHGMRSKRGIKPYEPYWPVRFYRGGDILLPKDKQHVMQVTDVVSMVDFMIHIGESGGKGPYNVAYPTETFENYVAHAELATNKPHTKHWVDASFLEKENIQPYKDLPYWRPWPPAFYNISVSKALEDGLINRPFTDMISDQLQGYLTRHPNDDFQFGENGTISSAKEAELLAKWNNA